MAGFEDALDSASPGLDHPGTEKGSGYVGIERARGVFGLQAGNGSGAGKLTGIPHHQFVRIDAKG